MGSDLKITNQLQEYILNHGLKLHSVQKDIIDYNSSLGEIGVITSFSSLQNLDKAISKLVPAVLLVFKKINLYL